jgi:hypothetical protein
MKKHIVNYLVSRFNKEIESLDKQDPLLEGKKFALKKAIEIIEETSQLKICIKCSEAKPESEFYQRKPSGFYNDCKKCDRLFGIEYYKKRVESLEYRVKRSKQKKEYYERKKQS